MRTVGAKPQSFSQLAQHIYGDLNGEQAEAAREKYNDALEARFKPYGLVRARPKKEQSDWFPRKGQRR
jgi:hypothetical protein